MLIASIIVTYRKGAGSERERNLVATINSLAQLTEHEVILVEQDTASTLAAITWPANVRHVFAFSATTFNKCWGLNLGARQSRAPWFGFFDADIVLTTSPQAIAAALRSDRAVIKPNTDVIDLSEADTVRYLQTPAMSLNHLPKNRAAQGEYSPLAAPACYLKRDAFQHLGAWDERFTGWGGEDDAFSYLIERARMPVAQLQGSAVHLWHPRAKDTTAAHEFEHNFQANLALLQEIRQSPDDVLKRFAEVNWQVMGNPDLYRPDPLRT